MIEAAQAQIEQEMQRAQEQMRKEVSALALKAAGAARSISSWPFSAAANPSAILALRSSIAPISGGQIYFMVNHTRSVKVII
jgi:hypothetical protein